MVDKVIQTISMEIEIKCKCGYEGEVIATSQYYIDCPECNKQVYVGRLTGAMK